MVISTVNKIIYNGNGTQTAWPFTFRIIDATDIRLLLVNSDGTETDIDSDYYVDKVNSTVYYPGYAPGSEPPEEEQPPKVQTGQKIVVYRELPATQLANLGDKWPFEVIELALDKLTMLIQQIKGIWDRCLKISIGTENFNAEVPVKPGKLLRVNNEGTGFEAVSDAPDSAAAAAESAKEAKDAADRATSILWIDNFVVVNNRLCQRLEDE